MLNIIVIKIQAKMMVSTQHAWQQPYSRMADPILSLTNKQTSTTQPNPTLTDRFMPDTCSMKMAHQLGLRHGDQNHNINTSCRGENPKYEEILLKACGFPKKKKNINNAKYQPKINRQGYLLNSEYFPENPHKQTRKIAAEPLKIISAPKLKDDFYTNLVDWGHNDQISVVLDNAAYLWSKRTNQTEKLIDGHISCVKWGRGLVIGEETGRLKIFDTEMKAEVQKWRKHEGRIGTIDIHGNQNLIASGSKDKSILIWDIRSSEVISKLEGHRQEICGLKWSHEGNYLASGGNENWVCLWNFRMNKLQSRLTEHSAAVKALAWSPHQHSILATGGGSTDKTIKIWNTYEQTCLKTIETGSQVCNMTYCKNTNELISTHGFSLNSVNVWNAETMKKISSLQGHTYRVLYLSKSPDEDTIVTGSGDQTLRFWRIYSNTTKNRESSELQLKNNFLR